MEKLTHSPRHWPSGKSISSKFGLFLLLLLLLPLLSGYASSALAERVDNIAPRIVGGTAAAPNAYPWSVALLYANDSNSFNAQFCGGTLIADRWVLTAAHCVDSISVATNIDAAIGIADLDDINATNRITISDIFIHPRYGTDFQDNDIALLRLSTPSTATVVALADNTLTNAIYTSTNNLLTIIGWGNTSNTGPPISSTLLQETQIPPFDFTNCSQIYTLGFTNNMICAAGSPSGGKDTCQGDSGGPMVYFNPNDNLLYQAGITSFGGGCALPDIPGVYTRVGNYLDWINGTITFASNFPDGYQFGYHGIERPYSKILTITNNSDDDITINNVSLSTMTDFSIFDQTCTSGTLPSSGSCTITLQFLTTNIGSQQDVLNIELNTGIISTIINGIVLGVVDAESLDETPARTWYSGGDAIWSNSSVTNSNGGTAMRSGIIADNESTVLLGYFTDLNGPNFRWKTSTESDFDILNLYIDGELATSISGNRDWGRCSALIFTGGEHRVTWVYKKDASENNFLDTVWLDSVNTPFSGSTAGCQGTLIDDSGTGGNGAGSSGFGGGGVFNGFFLLALLLLGLLNPLLSVIPKMTLNNDL
ncbi:MAG: serine protease [Ectothiorhodospiraceae bacterium]|nr:serine protease [Ectothiorhodospiraceae bacterium]